MFFNPVPMTCRSLRLFNVIKVQGSLAMLNPQTLNHSSSNRLHTGLNFRQGALVWFQSNRATSRLGSRTRNLVLQGRHLALLNQNIKARLYTLQASIPPPIDNVPDEPTKLEELFGSLDNEALDLLHIYEVSILPRHMQSSFSSVHGNTKARVVKRFNVFNARTLLEPVFQPLTDVYTGRGRSQALVRRHLETTFAGWSVAFELDCKEGKREAFAVCECKVSTRRDLHLLAILEG